LLTTPVLYGSQPRQAFVCCICHLRIFESLNATRFPSLSFFSYLPSFMFFLSDRIRNKNKRRTVVTTGRPAEYGDRSYSPQTLSYLGCCIEKQTLHFFILVINQIDAQIFFSKFISCLYMFRAPCAHHQGVKIVLYSIWYRHARDGHLQV